MTGHVSCNQTTCGFPSNTDVLLEFYAYPCSNSTDYRRTDAQEALWHIETTPSALNSLYDPHFMDKTPFINLVTADLPAYWPNVEE